MPRAVPVVLAVILAAACTQKNPEYCERDDDCADGERCELDPGAELTNACVKKDGGTADAPLGLDAAGVDAAVVDAPPVPCGDGGVSSCPANTPICRDGVCTVCQTQTECPIAAPVCGGNGTCGPCTTGSDQCELRTATRRCLAGGCVQCDRASDCALLPDRPVCEVTTGMCRPCALDDECTSGVCDLPNGRCVVDGDVLKVTMTGGGDCTTVPCASVAAALAKVQGTRRFVKIGPGTFREPLDATGKSVVLVGAGAMMTTIDPSGAANLPALNVGGGSDVTVRRLRLANASGDSNANGVTCAGTPRPKLTMLDVRVEDSDAVGVVANPCVLDIRRSRIAANLGGGVRIVASDFTLVNDVIVLNGSGASTVGGVRILDSPPNVGRLDFVTVGHNSSISTAVGGVACEGLTTGLAFTNSIVWGNSGAVNEVSGLCTWTFSLFPGASGATNLDRNPLFTDPPSRNLKPMSGSPAINAADMGSTVPDDIDGRARPQGGRRDMGAYEIE